MPFRPNVGDALLIDDVQYSIAEHPDAPGIPYGQEGRAAVVYQLVSKEGHRALKVFKPRFQVPSLVNLSERLAAFAAIPGLRVCKRSVITARRHIQLVRAHRDLSYAVLMPWVEGPTWMEALLGKAKLSPEQSLNLARALIEILSNMEERGLAHCDLSGPNLMLPALVPGYSGSSPIELVDVEQMYGEELKRPDFVPSGSSGYGHKNTPDGLWAANADRFAGALLISEMLGWCDEGVRQAAWGESYFDPDEIQQESDRFKLLVSVLDARWGSGIAHLLVQAWESDSLSDCAPFGHWLAALPDQVSQGGPVEAAAPPVAPSPPEVTLEMSRESRDRANALLGQARRYEDEGNLTSALATYRELRSMVPPGTGMAGELAVIISDLERGQQAIGGPSSHIPAEDQKLAALFDSALAAYRQAEWASAQELFAEVVRRKPDYQRNGRMASTLLATAEKRAAERFESTRSTIIGPDALIPATTWGVSVPPAGNRGFNWVFVPALVVATLFLFGGFVLLRTQFATGPGTDGRATATTSITAQPDTAATEQAIAGATATAFTQANEREQATIQAQFTRIALDQSADALSTSQAQANMQGTIKIVSSLPRTGLSKGQTDDIVAGYQMALEESNNKAGNFTIEYEGLDDATVQAGKWDAATEQGNAVRAANDPDVMVYLGTFNSGAAAISIPILNKAGLAMISPGNTAPELTKPGFDDKTYYALYTSGPKNYFRVTTADDVQSVAAANWAIELGFKKAYILNDQEVYGKGMARVFERQFGVNGGLVIANEGIDPRAADFESLASKVDDSGADLVFFGGLVDTGGPQLLKDLRAVAPNISFMGPDGIQSQAFIDAAGADVAEGVYATVEGRAIEDLGPEGKAFFNRFKSKYGREADPYAIYGYESMKVALNAIERAGKKDRAAILDAIRNTKDYQGALGTWSFDENGDISLDNIRAFKVQGGRFVFQKYIKAYR